MPPPASEHSPPPLVAATHAATFVRHLAHRRIQLPPPSPTPPPPPPPPAPPARCHLRPTPHEPQSLATTSGHRTACRLLSSQAAAHANCCLWPPPRMPPVHHLWSLATTKKMWRMKKGKLGILLVEMVKCGK
ncbi:hypothetical protein ABZP36_027648 [Zizania latifolia]